MAVDTAEAIDEESPDQPQVPVPRARPAEAPPEDDSGFIAALQRKDPTLAVDDGGSFVRSLIDPAKDQSFIDNLTGIQRRKIDVADQNNQRFQDQIAFDRKRTEQAYERQQFAAGALPAPWDADKERNARISGPFENFGSVATIFGMFASLATRQPLTSALNAGASAMEALHKSDEKAYESAYAAWKDNTTLALKQFDVENKMFDNSLHLMNTDLNNWRATSLANEASFNNKKALLFLQNGMDKEYLDAKESQAKAAVTMQKALEQGEIFDVQHRVFSQTVKDFDQQHPDATPAERMAFRLNTLREIKGGAGTRGLEQQLMMDATRQYWQENGHEPSADWKAETLRKIRTTGARTGVLSPEDQKIWDSLYQENLDKGMDDATARLDANRRVAQSHSKAAPSVRDESILAAQARLRKEHPEWDDAKVKLEAERQAAQARMGMGGELVRSPEALKAAAERYLQTGQFPPGMGGLRGSPDRLAVENMAAELAQQRGIDMKDLPKKWQEFKGEQIAIQRFMSGPQGNTIRSLGVVVDHLATMKQLAVALKNGQIPTFNRVAQRWAEETGQPAPTNFDTAKQIIGAEVIKAIGVAGAGTKSEREEAANAWNRARSPEQIDGAISTAQKLLAGQLRGIRHQFTQSTGLPVDKFNDMLPEEARTFLEGKQDSTGMKPGSIIRYDAQGNQVK